MRRRYLLGALLAVLVLPLALAAGGGGGGSDGGDTSEETNSELDLSCSRINVTINECLSTAEGIAATFSLVKASVEDLKYQFTLRDSAKVLTYYQTSHSTELKDLKVTAGTADDYQLRVIKGPEVDRLQISLPQCAGSHYVYSTIDCINTKNQVPPPAVPGTELKCGGYLELRDRVACRLQLREEQKDEYENFFPEECRSWQDQQQCVQLYRSVQSCWRLATSAARISCLREKVGITNVREQKSACGTDEACLQDLRKKVYTLIKLRLYNLEERAEELMEDGKLTKDEVADFVVKIEEDKLAFNQAQSKEERRAIIMQVRQHWLDLLRKVVEG